MKNNDKNMQNFLVRPCRQTGAIEKWSPLLRCLTCRQVTDHVNIYSPRHSSQTTNKVGNNILFALCEQWKSKWIDFIGSLIQMD